MNPSLLTLTLSPHSWWHLEWLCARTPCEVSTMGLLDANAKEGFRVEDFILVRQRVSPASVELDMDWWADKQAELYEARGVQPWQTSLWCHTHPAGVNQPSGTDEETMAQALGGWDFTLMLILTKAGQFYARAEFTHDFTSGARRRFSVPLKVLIDWTAPIIEPVTSQTLQRWEEEFKALVVENDYATMLDWSEWRPAKNRKDRLVDLAPPSARRQQSLKPKEYGSYASACQNMGPQPGDHDDFEEYFELESADDDEWGRYE